MKECVNCGFWSDYAGCTCNPSNRWYACSIENTKPENIQALKEYAEWTSKYEGEWVQASPAGAEGRVDKE